MYKGISHIAIDTGQDRIEALVATSDGEKIVEAFISPSSPRSGTSFGILGEEHENPQASCEDCRRKNVLLLQIEQQSIGQPFRWLCPEPHISSLRRSKPLRRVRSGLNPTFSPEYNRPSEDRSFVRMRIPGGPDRTMPGATFIPFDCSMRHRGGSETSAVTR
jgi:hypothetical protein